MQDTRGISFSINFAGTAEVDLEDIVGDRELKGVDQDAAREKASDALEGAELHIDIDGIPFVFHLHLA